MSDDTRGAVDVAGYNVDEALVTDKSNEQPTTASDNQEQLVGAARNFDKVFQAANGPYELIPTIHELDLLLDARDARQEGRL